MTKGKLFTDGFHCMNRKTNVSVHGRKSKRCLTKRFRRIDFLRFLSCLTLNYGIMITYKRCKEIFSDKKFIVRKRDTGLVAELRNVVDGWHYNFFFQLRPHGFNDCAKVDFGRWHPLCAEMLCFDICNEDFLNSLIERYSS